MISDCRLFSGHRARLVLLGVVALSGCKAADLEFVNPVPGGSGTLASYYVQSFDPYETIAANLRNGTARYIVQKIDNWYFTTAPSVLYSSYFLASSRAEYAHAVGLTGAGQTISIVDQGFLQSHEAFGGKTITTSGSIPVADHGTHVASVAAGNSPNMIGVAPGADLALGSFANYSTLTAATNAATQIGAVAQNNSWGYVGLYANTAGYQSTFGSPAGAGYLAALDAYAATGVVVFAVDNNNAATMSGIMDGLPVLRPSLENGWLAVGNAVPVFDATGVQSAQMVSAGCLQSAAWCLVADGASNGADASSTTAYSFGTGSSYAAPQVSGALALLGEAFPNLTPHELRARLLASADNSFFTADGSTMLAPGFSHDYSTTYGHGFLDIRAALLPIGSTSINMANGATISAASPIFATGAAMGDAVTQSLGGVSIAVSDSLNSGFTMPGAALTASAAPAPQGPGLLAQTLSSDLSLTRTAGAVVPTGGFAAYAGRTLDLSDPLGEMTASVLLPQSGSAAADYGVAVSRTISDGPTRVDVGLKVARDGGSVMGFSGPDARATDLVAVSLRMSQDLAGGGFVGIGGEVGLADLGAPSALTNVSTAAFNSVGIDIGSRGVFARGDKVTFGVSMPVAMTSGSAEIVLPVVMASGATAFQPIAVDLAPSDRQVDMSFSYQVPLGERSELMMKVLHSENYGNRAGLQDTAGVLAMTFRF